MCLGVVDEEPVLFSGGDDALALMWHLDSFFAQANELRQVVAAFRRGAQCASKLR